MMAGRVETSSSYDRFQCRSCEPQFFMDHDGLPLGAPGKPVLWYPDRNYFLLGKYLPATDR